MKSQFYSPQVSSLRINTLSLKVKIGVSKAERAKKQIVHVDIEFRFLEVPKATQTDFIEDTICYDLIAEKVRKHCETSEFKLIEKMGADCYSLIREELKGRSAQISIRVHKIKAPVKGLLGGTSFSCGDFIP